MYHYNDRELVENIMDPTAWLYFWYRDMVLDAEQRGLVTVNRAPNENPPFWWETSQVCLTASGQGLWDSRRV